MNWFKTVDSNEGITQGDIILECPVIGWKSGELKFIEGKQKETLKLAFEVIEADVVVMTQACDLENAKISNIILCPHLSLEKYKQAWDSNMEELSQNPTKKAWGRHFDDIRDGFIWNLTLLDKSNLNGTKMSPRIVDFHYVYSMPRSFLESHLASKGKPRLQLLPPFREHLSQAFARFFMRIGLPTKIENSIMI